MSTKRAHSSDDASSSDDNDNLYEATVKRLSTRTTIPEGALHDDIDVAAPITSSSSSSAAAAASARKRNAALALHDPERDDPAASPSKQLCRSSTAEPAVEVALDSPIYSMFSVPLVCCCGIHDSGARFAVNHSIL